MTDQVNICNVNNWPELGDWFRHRPVRVALWILGLIVAQIPMQLTAPTHDEIRPGDIQLDFIISSLFLALCGLALLGFGMPVVIAAMRCAGFKKS